VLIACNLRTQKVEAGGSKVQGHPWLNLKPVWDSRDSQKLDGWMDGWMMKEERREEKKERNERDCESPGYLDKLPRSCPNLGV
jgi:hypothetical protein